MSDGLECAAISVVTANALRAEGHCDPIPAYVASVLRRDGEVIHMGVLSISALRGLITSLSPDSSTIKLRYGPGDALAILVDLLTGGITLH